jgi:hypothetical protein
MHPRQMRDTVIPVLPSLVNSMLSPLRVNYVSPGAARYHELFERSARAYGGYKVNFPIPRLSVNQTPIVNRLRHTRTTHDPVHFFQRAARLILVPSAAEPYAAA